MAATGESRRLPSQSFAFSRLALARGRRAKEQRFHFLDGIVLSGRRPLMKGYLSGPIGLIRAEPRLRPTLSARLNLALPTFSRPEFIAKDVATEDSTGARGR